MSGKILEASSDAAQTQVNARPFIRLSKNIPNLFSQNFDASCFTKKRLWVNASLESKIQLWISYSRPGRRMANLPLDLQGSGIMNYWQFI